jgi:hypothetical protein
MFFAAGMGKPMMGSRSDLTHSFVVGNVRFLRSPDGWSRRKPDIADRDGGRRIWADCGPSSFARERRESLPKRTLIFALTVG